MNRTLSNPIVLDPVLTELMEKSAHLQKMLQAFNDSLVTPNEIATLGSKEDLLIRALKVKTCK